MLDELNGLVDYCNWDWTEGILELLEKDTSLDLTYDGGVVFTFAVQHNNMKILTALKEYYEKHKLSMDKNSAEYLDNLEALHKVMDTLENEEDINEDARAVIGEYLSEGRDKKKLQELDDMIENLNLSDGSTQEVVPELQEPVNWSATKHGLAGELSGNHHEIEAH